MPRFAGDVLPCPRVSAAVAMADKLDTIVGIFGIGQAPKAVTHLRYVVLHWVCCVKWLSTATSWIWWI